MIRSVFFAVLAGFTVTVASAQEPEVLEPTPARQALPIDIQADHLEADEKAKTATAVGNVVITQGDSVLRADSMTVNTETYDVHGQGNVNIRHEGRTYQGDEFHYNMKTREGDFETFLMQDGPITVAAEESERLSETEFLLKDAIITTCDIDKPEFYAKAAETRVTKGVGIRSKNVFFYLGGVPFFYLPVATHDFDEHKTNIDVLPGYSDRFGAFVLTAYNYRLADWLEAATRLDYRDRRGFAVGQDFMWRDPVMNTYEGEFRAYYLDDDRPYEDAEDEAATGELVDNERYRFKLRHRQAISDKDTLRLRGDYLSDPDILEDFFDREFRYNTQPENFATLTHRERSYIANLTVNMKVNDFYSNIDRAPEFSFQVPQMKLGDSSFYYTSQSAAAYLETSYADQLNRDNYDAGRIDSSHTISYVTRQFGFLNIIPRIGYAGTYYSKMLETSTQTETVATTNELGEVTLTEDSQTVTSEEGADFRNVFELGFDTSYKAFRVLDSITRGDDVGRRHVVEPFVGYTFIPEPNLEPEDLFQFDGIDQRDESNDLVFGVRNKLQTKRRGNVHDLVDLNVHTIYNVEKVNNETESLPFVYFDGEFRFIDGFWIDVDGVYDVPEGEVNSFNTQIALRGNDRSSASLEYRYRKDSRDLIAGQVNLLPTRKYSYVGYARYDIEEEKLEEHSHLITRKTDCIGVGLGVREIDSDLTVWAQMWLTAFPRGIAELGR